MTGDDAGEGVEAVVDSLDVGKEEVQEMSDVEARAGAGVAEEVVVVGFGSGESASALDRSVCEATVPSLGQRTRVKSDIRNQLQTLDKKFIPRYHAKLPLATLRSLSSNSRSPK